MNQENLTKNLKALPLTNNDMRSRRAFSKWVFKLHELINTMLGKKSGLKYCDVRERYEHFRSRCTNEKKFTTKILSPYSDLTGWHKPEFQNQ